MKRFFKGLLVSVLAFVCAFFVVGCDWGFSDYDDPFNGSHTCESVCPICNKCTDQSCQDPACQDKCQGHGQEHVCESVCPVCNKCTDQSCQEPACQDKCECPPVHECESKCPTCGKCKDKTCDDPACAEKCNGHSGGLTNNGNYNAGENY